jgi:hypothetical protein
MTTSMAYDKPRNQYKYRFNFPNGLKDYHWCFLTIKNVENGETPFLTEKFTATWVFHIKFKLSI